ncbi:unnamed protein product [Clonostachys byssicola]|uniref:Uncharacterized protein n=1 Tax=Clonostachys byssicola TaxID=160290 RepID=A0A9N9U2B2_9HYPO|nr:unnamed protein product [Clonostachys byssicola]
MPLWGLLDRVSQLFPPQPDFTEDQVPDLHGKVYIVTGANTGVGKLLTEILYSRNAKIYVAARSEEKANNAIASIKETAPGSKGELVFLHLDLADLATIKASADNFLRQESKLHVLFNNAGVLFPPAGSKTAQGYEVQLGVNNVGTFMFTKLLTPVLVETAKTEEPGTVRVVWVSSSAAESPSVPRGGVDLGNIDQRGSRFNLDSYALSKAGNYLHAVEFAERHRADGIASIPLNPGNLKSDLWRTQFAITKLFLSTFFLHPPKLGAYTELFAGLSPKVTMEKTGHWVGPWGRFMPIRNDLQLSTKSKEEGGYGTAKAFWEWNEEQIKPYL